MVPVASGRLVGSLLECFGLSALAVGTPFPRQFAGILFLRTRWALVRYPRIFYGFFPPSFGLAPYGFRNGLAQIGHAPFAFADDDSFVAWFFSLATLAGWQPLCFVDQIMNRFFSQDPGSPFTFEAVWSSDSVVRDCKVRSIPARPT